MKAQADCERATTTTALVPFGYYQCSALHSSSLPSVVYDCGEEEYLRGNNIGHSGPDPQYHQEKKIKGCRGVLKEMEHTDAFSVTMDTTRLDLEPIQFLVMYSAYRRER